MIERPHFTYIFATPNQTINREAAANAERQREIRSIILRSWHPVWYWKPISLPHPIVRPIIFGGWRPISSPWHPIIEPIRVWRSTLNEEPPVHPIWHPILLLRPPVLNNMTLPPKRTDKEILPPFPHPTPNFHHTPDTEPVPAPIIKGHAIAIPLPPPPPPARHPTLLPPTTKKEESTTPPSRYRIPGITGRVMSYMEHMGSPVSISSQTTQPSNTQSNETANSLPNIIAQRTINHMEAMGSPVSISTPPQTTQSQATGDIKSAFGVVAQGAVQPQNTKNSGGGIFGFFSGLANDIINGLGDLGSAVQNAAKSPLVAQGAVQPQGNSGGGIFGFFSGLGSDVVNVLANAGKAVQNTATTAANDIKNVLGSVNNAIQSAYAAAYGASNNISQEKQQLTQQYDKYSKQIQQDRVQLENELQQINTEQAQLQQEKQKVQQEYEQQLAQIQQAEQQVQNEYKQLAAENPNSQSLNQWYNSAMQQLNADLQSLNQWYNSAMQQLNNEEQQLLNAKSQINNDLLQLQKAQQNLNTEYQNALQQLNKSQSGGNPFQNVLNDIADLSALVGYYGTEALGGAGEELAHLASGKGLENFSQAMAQFNKAGGQNVARAVGDVTEVALPAIVTAVTAPELLPAVIIGEASSVGLGEAISKLTTGQFQSLGQVLQEANEGGVLGAVGELGGLALESGLARGAGALTKLITGSEDMATKIAELTPVWRGIGGAATNAGIQAIFTQNPEQIGVAALIGGLAGGLGPGVAGKLMSKIDELRGTGVVAEPEILESPLDHTTTEAWKAVLPNGDIVHIVPRTNFGAGGIESVEDFVQRYANELGEDNLVAHVGRNIYKRLASGETVEVKPGQPGSGAFYWRGNILKNFLDMYWSPGEGPNEAVALAGYAGLKDTGPGIPDVRAVLSRSKVSDVLYRLLHPFEIGGMELAHADIEPGPLPPDELVDFVKANRARTGSMNETASRIMANPEYAQMLANWRNAVETFSAKNGVLVPGSEDLMGLSHERQVVLAPGTKLEPTGEVYNIWMRKTPELFENLPGPLRDILSDWVKMKAVYVDIIPGEPANLIDINKLKDETAGEREELIREENIPEEREENVQIKNEKLPEEREETIPVIREENIQLPVEREELTEIQNERLPEETQLVYNIPLTYDIPPSPISNPPSIVNPPSISNPPPSPTTNPPPSPIINPPPSPPPPPPPTNNPPPSPTTNPPPSPPPPPPPPPIYNPPSSTEEETVVTSQQSPPPPVFNYQDFGPTPMGPPPMLPAIIPGGFAGNGNEVQEISGMAGEVLNL